MSLNTAEKTTRPHLLVPKIRKKQFCMAVILEMSCWKMFGLLESEQSPDNFPFSFASFPPSSTQTQQRSVARLSHRVPWNTNLNFFYTNDLKLMLPALTSVKEILSMILPNIKFNISTHFIIFSQTINKYWKEKHCFVIILYPLNWN